MIADYVIGYDGYRFDVDDIKQLLKKHSSVVKDEKERSRVASVDFNKSDDVNFMHQFAKKRYEKPQYKTSHSRIEGFYRSALSLKDKTRLPNILFSITGKDIKDIEQYAKPLIEAGYQPKNVHLVWILTPSQRAIEANKTRGREVPNEVVLKSHRGCKTLIKTLLKNEINFREYLDGSITVIFNYFLTEKQRRDVKNGAYSIKNDVQFKEKTTKNKDGEKTTRYVEKVKKVSLKEAGQPIKTEKEISNKFKKLLNRYTGQEIL